MSVTEELNENRSAPYDQICHFRQMTMVFCQKGVKERLNVGERPYCKHSENHKIIEIGSPSRTKVMAIEFWHLISNVYDSRGTQNTHFLVGSMRRHASRG